MWQQPIVYGEEDAAAKVACKDDPAENTIPRPMEEPQEKTEHGTEVGGESKLSPQDNLQALADDMDARRELNTHAEVDRELGLVFRNDRDFRWHDLESSTDRRQVHYGGRAQDDGATANPGTAVGVDETIPTSPSYLYPPEHAIWGVPADEPPLPHTKVRAKRGILATHVPPVISPSDGAIDRPVPSTPEKHLVPPQKANRSRLLNDSDVFAGQPARRGGLGELEETLQPLPSGRHQYRHDEDGSGFAVARARHRLYNFRAAREIISTDHGHENVPSQDQHAMPTSQYGAKATLGRLKEMRCLVLA